MPTIHDVRIKDLTINADDRGHLTEIYRTDWEFFNPSPSMAYYSVSYPGIIRAWHRHHRGQVDYFVCPHGRIKVGIFDDRESSPTNGNLDTIIMGEQSQKIVRVPGDCWHGFKVVGDKRATLINFPTNLYDYDDPDEERLPYDTDKIPLDWEAEPHE